MKLPLEWCVCQYRDEGCGTPGCPNVVEQGEEALWDDADEAWYCRACTRNILEKLLAEAQALWYKIDGTCEDMSVTKSQIAANISKKCFPGLIVKIRTRKDD